MNFKIIFGTSRGKLRIDLKFSPIILAVQFCEYALPAKQKKAAKQTLFVCLR